ncbi:MAG TPA: PPC domain-containing protein [Pirellulales bacterium]|nr:PPC domain-containing protein [Pirellulales bacterium]
MRHLIQYRTLVACSVTVVCLLAPVFADEPAVSYIFPAGGQRGTKVDFRVGGMYLHEGAALEMLGAGVTASARIVPTETIWFEGPVIPLPASQQKEDYPKDYSGQVDLAADAPLGLRRWRVSTSQGAAPSMKFVVGDLPEIVEQEIDGGPLPVQVTLPVTINGRIFPREDVDDWTFHAKAGEPIRAEVLSSRLGYPLEARLVLYGPAGRPLAEDVGSLAGDACLRATIPADGTYRLRIHDVNFGGLQHYVYRLNLTRGPYIERVYPLGGRRGGTVRLELDGQGVPVEAVEVAVPADAPSWYAARLPLAGGESNQVNLEIDDLDELLEREPNDLPRQAATLAAPAVANGRIGVAGDRDYWAFAAKRGDVFDVAVSSARLGSPLDAVLVVEDAAGKELLRAEESPGSQNDCRLRFTAPADGSFYVRVADRFASRGGQTFAYRLRITPAAAPDFRLTFAADALSLDRKSQAKLRVTAERLGGLTGPIKLAADGLPPGVSVQGGEIAANKPHADLTFVASQTSKIEAAHVVVRGTAEISGQAVTHTATLAGPPGEMTVDNVLLAVSMPTPFKIIGKYDLTFVPRGSTLVRHYAIDRGGFTGPLRVLPADRQARHLQGVTGPLITVPPGADECEYPLFLPPWMELARTSRSVVMAVGVVADTDGSQHTVSFTSQNQNEQIVALVGPGELSVHAERTSLECVPGGECEVRLRLARDRSLTGPTRVELVLPPHIHGIVAEPATVPSDAERAVLRIHCDREFGPLNMPLIVRATTEHGGRPVTAEAQLQLVGASRKP